MRTVKLTDVEAGMVYRTLQGRLSVSVGTISEVDRYEREGFQMTDGSPMPEERVVSLKRQRDKAFDEAKAYRDLADKFLGAD